MSEYRALDDIEFMDVCGMEEEVRKLCAQHDLPVPEIRTRLYPQMGRLRSEVQAILDDVKRRIKEANQHEPAQ